MHYCTALFHEADSDPESLMHPYSYENEEYQKFDMDYTKKDAENEFKRHCKKHPEDANMEMDEFMEEFCSCYEKDDDGNYGNRNNPNGLYDWFEVGGRWKKILYSETDKNVMKKRQDADLKNKSKYELKEYIRLRMMSPKKYCTETSCLGKTTIQLKDFDVKSTLEMNRHWTGKTKNIEDLFYTVICEEQGIYHKGDFDTLLAYWKKKGGVLTVIDYHS
jgi:hypothetical protein